MSKLGPYTARCFRFHGYFGVRLNGFSSERLQTELVTPGAGSLRRAFCIGI